MANRATVPSWSVVAVTPDGAEAAAAHDPTMPNVGSSWLDEVNRAMRLPPAQGRALLDDMIAQRRRRAAELRARISSDVENTRQHGVFALMAAWVDDSIGLLERARAHLGTGPAARPHRGGSEQAGRVRPTGPDGAGSR